MTSDPTPEPRGSTAPDPEGIELSIVLATLNERANLPELVRRIRAQPLPSYEILIVDDGSTDGTREYVHELSREDGRVRLLSHEGRQTTLRAQSQGIEEARGNAIAILDADLQHPPEVLPALLGELKAGAALAVASRYAPGGSAGPRTAFRWTISRGAEWLTKALLPPARGVADPVSGFFAFRREIWSPLNPLYRGYKLLIFVLVMAEGRPIREVPFRFTPRTEGASKVTGSGAFFRVFVTELILARRFRTRVGARAGTAASSGPSLSTVMLLL